MKQRKGEIMLLNKFTEDKVSEMKIDMREMRKTGK